VATWTVTRRGWFSRTYGVLDEQGNEVGELRHPTWQDQGAVVTGGVEYAVSTERVLGVLFVLGQPGAVVANGVLRDELPQRPASIAHGERQYSLEAGLRWDRELFLFEKETRVGRLTRRGIFSRHIEADLPAEILPCVRLFIVWLAILYWKRNAAALGERP